MKLVGWYAHGDEYANKAPTSLILVAVVIGNLHTRIGFILNIANQPADIGIIHRHVHRQCDCLGLSYVKYCAHTS